MSDESAEENEKKTMTSEPEQLRKIFVGGLNRRTTEETMKEYFSRWGNIVDCVIMREGKNGPSRGFGFVTFDNSKAVDDCLQVKHHKIDNWEIEPKRSVPKGEAQSRTRKIFVGGLASTATEEDVEEYFTGLCTKFGTGKVLDVDLKRDKDNPNRLRGFAFVTFDNEEVVDSVCAMNFHQIKLKQCEVKKAESQATMRKKEEQEMIASGGSRRSNSEHDSSNFGGFPGWGPNAGFGGMGGGFGGSGGRGNFGGNSGSSGGGGGGGSSSGGFGGGGMGGAGGMGGFGGGNFNTPAAAAAMMASGFNPAAFAAFSPGGMGNFGPGFGFNSMGFGGFGPGFFGFGGFGPGGFGGGGSGGGSGSGGGASGYGTGGGGGYGRGASSGRGLPHNSSGSYDKDSYSELSGYGMGDMKSASQGERNPSSVMPGAVGSSSAGSGYEGVTNPMAAAYGGYPGFAGGFGGFPTMGDWSQLAAAAGGGSGVGGGEGGGDYQIGNYSQMNSNYGPTSRLNNRTISGGDKNNRGYRPY